MTPDSRAVGRFSFAGIPSVASVVLVSLILVSGIAFASPTKGGDGPSTSPSLVIISMSKASGPSYIAFTVATPLPSGTVAAKMGPFAPGDSVTVDYTVENTGNIPASLSFLGVTVTPPGKGFTGANGPIPSALNPGASFTSTITITLQAGLGNSYEGETAAITLEISGTGITTTTTCTTTATHTATHVVTTTRTVTVTTTKTMTDTITRTMTVTSAKTTAKGQDSPLDVTAFWTTTSSCITVTVTITSTSTTTQTSTKTQTTFTTVTKTLTTTKTVPTTTCTGHDSGK